MRLDREGRRTLAQFLNGIAVAAVGMGVLAPVLEWDLSWRIPIAIILGGGFHIAAAWIVIQ